jgi:uncharacterized protein (TIGR02246 family)
MRKTIIMGAVALAASLTAISCGDMGTSNNANRPANNASNTNSTAAANPAAVEAEIRKLVTDTAAALAKNDADALDRLYSDNYMLVNLDGSVQNKAERLAQFRSGKTKFDSFTYDEVNVRTNPEGTGAVVIGRALATGMNNGAAIPAGRYVRVTQVWSKTKDGWRQVSGHATTMTDDTSPGAANTSTAPANAVSNTATNR